MVLSDKELRKVARRPDVEVSLIGEYLVLRFGKGGGSRPPSPRTAAGPGKVTKIPRWVQRRILRQRERLEEYERRALEML